MIPRGKQVTLTATLTRLYDDHQGFRMLNIRNNTGNDVMYFANGPAAGDIIGYLKADEQYTFRNVDAYHVYVKGTQDDILYVSGDDA